MSYGKNGPSLEKNTGYFLLVTESVIAGTWRHMTISDKPGKTKW